MQHENYWRKVIKVLHLFRRYYNNELNDKQEKAMEEWNPFEEDSPAAHERPLSQRLVRKHGQRVKQRVYMQIGLEPYEVQKRKLVRPWITYSGIAAAIALLIAISLPLLKDGGADKAAPSELVVQAELAQQFITEGTMKKITLADGSIVHMNMGSTLSLYKGKFNGHTREVWLDEGEAFFEVTKDKNRPFIVHTADGLSTRVLGTSFNIKAYRELDEQVVSVKTGRVQVSKEDGDRVVLDPDNKVSFDTENQTLTAGITDGNMADHWRNGTIVLDDASFKEVALRLHQAFGIEVSGNEVAQSGIRINSSFSTDTSLPVIAQALASVYKARYRINNKQLSFYY